MFEKHLIPKIISEKQKDEFIEEAYQKAIAKIAKSGLCLANINSNLYEI